MYQKPTNPGYLGGFSWGSASALLGTVSIGNTIATQWVARQLGEQAALGTPLFRIFGHGYYKPWSWADWGVRFFVNADNDVRHVLLVGFALAVGSLVLGVILARLLSNLRFRKLSKGGEDLHGSSRFAEKKDLRKHGLIGHQSGLIIGGWHDKETNKLLYLRHRGPEHVLCFAPPRSGKGVSLVIPNLLEHPGGVIVHDVKGELWNATAGYRSQQLGQRCIKFAPAEEGSDGFNPLEEVRLGTIHEIKDAQNIANMLVRTVEETGNNKHWLDTAESFVTGIILHVCYMAKVEQRIPCLADVYNALTPFGMSLQEYLNDMLDYQHDPQMTQGWTMPDGTPTKTHPVVRQKITEQLGRQSDKGEANNEFSSVASSAQTPFSLFSDPLVKAATAKSSFRIADLLESKTPLSIYIVVPPSDKKRLRPLLRLIFTQMVNRLTERMDYEKPTTTPEHRLLFMMDEFASIGKMDLFLDALSYMPGYHLQAFIVIQSMAQLMENYGAHNSMMDVHHVKVAFAPNSLQSAQTISGMTGEITIQRAALSFSSGQGGLYGSKQVSSHVEHVKRPLMTPEEVMRLKGIQKIGEGEDARLLPGDMLIFIAGVYPIFGMQSLFSANPELKRRCQIPAPAKNEPQTSPLTGLQAQLTAIAEGGTTVATANP